MLIGVAGLVAVFLAPQTPAGEVRPASSFRHGLSAAAAESLARKLEAVERPRPEGSDGVVVEALIATERELNSYLNLATPPRLPAGLSDVEFRLERDRVEARGLVDLDQVKVKAGSRGPLDPLALLGGWVEVEVKGRLLGADGMGTLTVEEARLGPLSLPVSVLERIVAAATRTEERPGGLDLRSPFPLPYSAKRMYLEPGRVRLEF